MKRRIIVLLFAQWKGWWWQWMMFALGTGTREWSHMDHTFALPLFNVLSGFFWMNIPKNIRLCWKHVVLNIISIFLVPLKDRVGSSLPPRKLTVILPKMHSIKCIHKDHGRSILPFLIIISEVILLWPQKIRSPTFSLYGFVRVNDKMFYF